MNRILVDVDTQYDFVDPSGALHVPAPDTVPAAICELLRDAADQGVPVVGSVDSHAYDAWEFEANGGPFPAHCVKGTRGWLRVVEDRPQRRRFVPMQPADVGGVLVGESTRGQGNRTLDVDALATEARSGVGLYFEKEVYSLFSNPMADPVLAAVVEAHGGATQVVFDVIGYCTGGYCVDAAAQGLASRGYQVRVLGWATAPIGGDPAQHKSRETLQAAGVEWVEAP